MANDPKVDLTENVKSFRKQLKTYSKNQLIKIIINLTLKNMELENGKG